MMYEPARFSGFFWHCQHTAPLAYSLQTYSESKDGEMMKHKQRCIYAAIFGILLLTEILIGLFVHDRFIRPYFGDVLVTILICCLCRTVVPNGGSALPVYVFVFASLVEVAQYFDIVTLLGLEDSKLLSTIIGTSFSPIDLICYSIGCLMFWAAETAVKKRASQRNRVQ